MDSERLSQLRRLAHNCLNGNGADWVLRLNVRQLACAVLDLTTYAKQTMPMRMPMGSDRIAQLRRLAAEAPPAGLPICQIPDVKQCPARYRADCSGCEHYKHRPNELAAGLEELAAEVERLERMNAELVRNGGQALHECARLRDALRAAHHELTTHHGLVVTDKPGEYRDALAEGLDHNAAIDCQREVSWTLDTSTVCQAIDAVLAEAGEATDAPTS